MRRMGRGEKHTVLVLEMPRMKMVVSRERRCQEDGEREMRFGVLAQDWH